MKPLGLSCHKHNHLAAREKFKPLLSGAFNSSLAHAFHGCCCYFSLNGKNGLN
jgi:hypothetical protein